MLEVFEQLAQNLKAKMKDKSKHSEIEEKPIKLQKECIVEENLSVCSETIEINDDENQHFMKTKNKIKKQNYVNVSKTPVIYFTVNLSLIAILLVINYRNENLKEIPEFFNLYTANILIFRLYHYVSVGLGLLTVTILFSSLKQSIHKQKGFKDIPSLDMLIFFGILFNLFDLSLTSFSSSKFSLKLVFLDEYKIYLISIFIAYNSSIIIFQFSIILLISSLKKGKTDNKWFNYKVVTLIYTCLTLILYLYCLMVKYSKMKLILLSILTIEFLLLVLPYLLLFLSNLLILSNYDLFENSRFFIRNSN